MHHPASNRSAKADANEELRAKEEQRRKRLPIRERLRIWDEEHHDEVKTMLSDFADSGELSNSYTRPQNVSMANPEIASPLFDGDELGDLRSEDSNLNPGDMVELRYVKLRPSTMFI